MIYANEFFIIGFFGLMLVKYNPNPDWRLSQVRPSGPDAEVKHVSIVSHTKHAVFPHELRMTQR